MKSVEHQKFLDKMVNREAHGEEASKTILSRRKRVVSQSNLSTVGYMLIYSITVFLLRKSEYSRVVSRAGLFGSGSGLKLTIIRA